MLLLSGISCVCSQYKAGTYRHENAVCMYVQTLGLKQSSTLSHADNKSHTYGHGLLRRYSSVEGHEVHLTAAGRADAGKEHLYVYTCMCTYV